MRRFLAWAAGAAGGLAAYRFLARRQPVLEPPPAPGPEPEVDPRAAELRAKLDATREPDSPSDNVSLGEEETPEERRARVHERGRAAVDEMRHGE